MTTHWWRAYDEAVDDPKIQLMPGPLFKAWFNLLCIASGNDGRLPPVESIAFKLRTTEAKVGSMLEDLVERGLLDDHDGVLRPHNWGERQFASDSNAAERQKRYRDRHRNVTRNVTSDGARLQITDSDTEKKESCRVADATPTSAKVLKWKYSEEFEGFWRPYPKTPVMSKAEAWKAWGKLPPEDRKAAIAAVPRFIEFLRSKPDHPAVHACRFLSQRRFDGFGTGIAPERTDEQRIYLEKLERMKADAAAGLAVSWEN